MKGFFISLCVAAGFIFSSLTGKNVIIIGDSITYGVGASDNAHRWSTIFCGLFGGNEVNMGISGQVVETGNACGSHPIFDISTVPTKGSQDGLLVIALGVNDIGVNVGHTPSSFQIRLLSIIDAALSKNWQPGEILIIAPFNITGYDAYLGGCSVSVASDDTRALAYRDATHNVAIARHTLWVDARQICLNNSGGNPTSWTVTDGVHPNNTGHAGYANGFYNAILIPQ